MFFEEPLSYYLFQNAFPVGSFLPYTTQQELEMKSDRRSAAVSPSSSSRPFASNKRTASKAANKVAPRLYLTCLATAKDEKQLAQLGITHVVSAIEHAPKFPSSHPLRTLHIPISDYDSEDILSHLPATTSFIRGALEESPTNRVLVHCFMGISRSSTIVIAYLVATRQMTPHQALAAVQSKRAIVRPNSGFMSQLEEYYSTCSNPSQANLASADAEDLAVPKRENEKSKPEARRSLRRAQAAGGGGDTALGAKNVAKS